MAIVCLLITKYNIYNVSSRYPTDVFGLTPLQLAKKNGKYGILGLMDYIIHNKVQ